MSAPDAVDVAIVGAGAAGLAAARRLGDLRPAARVVVLEALDRVGGRAHSVLPPPLRLPLDLGCGWLHGARTNAWTRIAREMGFVIDRTPAPWDRGGRDISLAPVERASSNAAVAAFFERAEALPDAEPDRALGDLLEPGNPWNGVIGAIGTYINGAELGEASIRDYQRYEPGPGPDWRVVDGYGRLVAAFGAEAPVRLETVVASIDHRDATTVTLETSRGTLRARAVVVTVSTDVLASGAIRFLPALPAKAEAAAGLPLGLADKLYLRVAEPDGLPLDEHMMGSARRSATGAYQIRPFGWPVIECFLGGDLARGLARDGEPAAVEFARAELAQHFGADVARRLTPLAMSAWSRHPSIRGAYSFARPGAADRRATLAEPVDGRLFFAGEATSPHRFSTAHGAYESGVAAAEALAAGLARPVSSARRS